MPKEIYIIGGLPSEDYDRFKNRIIGISRDLIDQYGPETLKINLTVKAPPAISVIPFKRKKVAVISLNRTTGASMDLATKAEGFIGAYLVEEVIPVAYNKTWADGETTPGECLLTLFHSRPGIDRETFLRRWHEGAYTPFT